MDYSAEGKEEGNEHFTYRYQYTSLAIARFKVYCFEHVLRDTAKVRFSVGEKFSASVLDRCKPSIMMNLDSY